MRETKALQPFGESPLSLALARDLILLRYALQDEGSRAGSLDDQMCGNRLEGSGKMDARNVPAKKHLLEMKKSL